MSHALRILAEAAPGRVSFEATYLNDERSAVFSLADDGSAAVKKSLYDSRSGCFYWT